MLCSHEERTRGAHEHYKRELFLKGREEYPVFRASVQRKREARVSTTNGNYYQEDENKNLLVVLMRGNIERRA